MYAKKHGGRGECGPAAVGLPSGDGHRERRLRTARGELVTARCANPSSPGCSIVARPRVTRHCKRSSPARDRHRAQRLRRVGVGAVVGPHRGCRGLVTVVREQGRFSTATNSPRIAAPAAASLTWRAASSTPSNPARSAAVNGSSAIACPMDAPWPADLGREPGVVPPSCRRGRRGRLGLLNSGDFAPQASVGLTPDLPVYESCAAGSSLDVLTTIGATSHDLVVAGPRTGGARIGAVVTTLYPTPHATLHSSWSTPRRRPPPSPRTSPTAARTRCGPSTDGPSSSTAAQPQATTAGFGSVTVSTTGGGATTRAVLQTPARRRLPTICLRSLPRTPVRQSRCDCRVMAITLATR